TEDAPRRKRLLMPEPGRATRGPEAAPRRAGAAARTRACDRREGRHELRDSPLRVELEAAAFEAADRRGRWPGRLLLPCAAPLLGGASPPRRAPLRGRPLGGRALRGAALGRAALGGRALGGAPLRGAALGGRALRGAALRGRPLGGAALGGRALGGAALRGAALGGRALRGAALRGA